MQSDLRACGSMRVQGNPDRSGVYLQCTCSATQCTLQPMQCTCSIGCSYTADTLQTAVYTVPAEWSLMAAFCTLHIHCQQVAVYLQCTCSLHCSYTAHTLPVHSTSVWEGGSMSPKIGLVPALIRMLPRAASPLYYYNPGAAYSFSF